MYNFAWPKLRDWNLIWIHTRSCKAKERSFLFRMRTFFFVFSSRLPIVLRNATCSHFFLLWLSTECEQKQELMGRSGRNLEWRTMNFRDRRNKTTEPHSIWHEKIEKKMKRCWLKVKRSFILEANERSGNISRGWKWSESSVIEKVRTIQPLTFIAPSPKVGLLEKLSNYRRSPTHTF